MKQRPLGSSGLSVGSIAFGCWRFAGTDLPTASERITTALDLGMTLIDTADVYGLDNNTPWGAAEALLGDVLAAAPSLRDRMVLATKGGIHLGPSHQGRDGFGVPYESRAEWITHACEQSLRRLRTDVIDVYQIHRPDLLAHPAEVAGALTSLVSSGKVRFIGVSNYSASQTRALQAHLDVPLVTTQPEYSVAHLDPIDDGVFDLAMEVGLTPLAWSPLAGGRLVDAGARGADAADPRIAAITVVVDELAEAHSTDRAGVALAFVLAHPSGAIPILGTGSIDRIHAAAEADTIELTKAECYRLIAAAGRRLP